MKPVVVTTLPMLDQIQRELGKWARVIVPASDDSETLLRVCRDAHAVVVRSKLPDDIFAHCPQLAIAARHGVGLDMIPVQEANRHAVLVSNTPHANANAVAEYVLAHLLRALRNSHQTTLSIQPYSEHTWHSARAVANYGRELGKCKVGIIGYGAIGSRVAQLLLAIGTRVAVHSRRDPMHQQIEFASLAQLAASCDAIVLCCPLTAQTHSLINEKFLSRMLDNSVLINVSRGPVIDTTALTRALQNGPLGTAVLDVFDQHPLPTSSPLLTVNTLLSPHVAGISKDSMLAMGECCLVSVRTALSGQQPPDCVNPEIYPQFRARTLLQFQFD